MDEFKILQEKLNNYLTNLGNIYEIGINNITPTKDKLDEFLKDFYDLYRRLDVPETNKDLLSNIKNEITEYEKIVEENKKELDKIKTEKQKLGNDIANELRNINSEINKLKDMKDHESDINKVKELRSQIEELENRKRALLHDYNIIYKGGKYSNVNNKRAITSTNISKPKGEVKSVNTSSPSKPKNKKETTVNSIRYYVEKNMLPNNIKQSEWKKICSELGIKMAHTNTPISEYEFEKLKYSKVVHEASMRASIESRHKKVIKEYDVLIQKYKKLSSEMTSPELASSKKEIDALISKFEVEKSDYISKINDLGYSVENYFTFEQTVSNDAGSKKASKVDSKLSEVDDKLKDAYRTLDNQKEELSRSNSKFKKAIVNRRISKTMAIINRLQNKQGKLSTTQNMIINASTTKYIEKKNKEKQKQLEEHRKMSEFTQKINDIDSKKSSLETEIQDVSKDIDNISGNRIRDKIDRMSLQHSRRKLESELKRLKNKQGMMILANQVRQSVSSSLGR